MPLLIAGACAPTGDFASLFAPSQLGLELRNPCGLRGALALAFGVLAFAFRVLDREGFVSGQQQIQPSSVAS